MSDTMNAPAVAKVPLVRMGITIGVGFVGGSLALLASSQSNYSELHTILNTSMCLLSFVLALLFMDQGAQTDRPFQPLLAISFTVTALLELVHVFSTVEWS